MEIFLLLVVIILLIIFHSVKNTKISILEKKLSNIEEYLKKIQFIQSQQSTVAKTDNTSEVAQKPAASTTVIPPLAKEPMPLVKPDNQTVTQPIKVVEQRLQEVKADATVPKPHQQVVAPPRVKDGWYDSFRKNNPDLEKFIGENILSKIAITVLVIGIAFFVKFAIDNDWINEIARVGVGILSGAIVLLFAHRLHKNFKAFSSVLVAGGIAIFYFTIGIAFHQYQLFNQTTAFVLMVIITCLSVVFSIAYNRAELAALSLIGGFATPFILSTGQGNYIVLFTYILILDIGMLVLAYLRKWNSVNIIAYFFTMLLYVGWLQTKAIGQPNAPYKGAIIYAAIFYVVFILMNVLNNLKEKQKFSVLDISILISNTFLFYGLGMQILSHYHPELKGLFCLLLALFNLVSSWLLYKKFNTDSKLIYLMIGLTLTFITLIAPVQLKGNYITLFWASEAVLLIWLAQKSSIVLYRFVSIIISALMCFSLIMDWVNLYAHYTEVPIAIIFNKAFITGIFSSVSLLLIIILLRKETESVSYLGLTFNPKGYNKVLKVLFIIFLYLTGLWELIYQFNERLSNGFSITIIIVAYHLLYFSILNGVIIKTNYTSGIIPMYVFNFINAVLFVLCFSHLPVLEFKHNFINGYSIQIGFIFHYVSIICFVFTLMQMHKTLLSKAPSIPYSKILNTILVSFAVIYLSSWELILHALKIALPTTSVLSDGVLLSNYSQYQIATKHIIKIGFPILWGIIAFVFLYFGMKKSNKTLRIIALVLIAITLVKLFSYDIKDASDAGKILAFIILGIVLLIISFMYQKIKALLLKDENEHEKS